MPILHILQGTCTIILKSSERISVFIIVALLFSNPLHKVMNAGTVFRGDESMFHSPTASYTAALFLFVIMLSIYSDKRDQSLRLFYYLVAVWICMAGLLIEGTFYAIYENPKLLVLSAVLYFLSFFLSDYMLIFYALYIQSLAGKTHRESDKSVRLVIVLCLINSALCLILTLSGRLFGVENGVITGDILSSSLAVAPGICLMILIIYTLRRGNTLGRTYTIALCSYYFLAIINAVICYTFPDFQTGYVGPALASVMVYVFIQSNSLAEAQGQAETYNRLSGRDVLTGLMNRRSFNEKIEHFQPSTEIGIIYCDLNGLKGVNDNEGHEAGDRYIQKMASLLQESFSYDEIFRVGGDEFFVVLILRDGEESFEKRFSTFEKILYENDELASCGHSRGPASNSKELLQQAETRMYAEKELFYKRSGKDRRYQ